MGGVQSQYAPSSYIGLWTRLAGFERAQLTRALERRTVVQGTLMRGTIHIVSARDYWPLAAGIRDDSRKWWLGATRHQISEREVAAVASRVRDLLADGPRRRKELMAELGVTSTVWNGVGGWVEPASRAAVGDVGAPLGRPLRRVGGLAVGIARRHARPRARAHRPPLLGRLRSGVTQGHRELGGHLGDHARAGPGADAPPAASVTSAAESSWICRARRSPTPTSRRPSDSCPRGTPRCSCTRAGRRSSRSASAPRCST